MKRNYIISTKENECIISLTTYESFSYNIHEIQLDLIKLNFKGQVIIDSLTALGFADNRFLDAYFNGETFDVDLFKIYTPSIDFIKKRNEFYKQRGKNEFKKGVLSFDCVNRFFDCDDFLD